MYVNFSIFRIVSWTLVTQILAPESDGILAPQQQATRRQSASLDMPRASDIERVHKMFEHGFQTPCHTVMHDMNQSLHLSNRLCARDTTFAVRQ
jgi:hypothetical protein